MRYVSDISPVTTGPTTSLVPGVTAVNAIKPIHARDPVSLQVSHVGGREQPLVAVGNLPTDDRRKACRRIHHQKVLIELRSGPDRRRHDLFVGGAVDHIDEQA